MKSQRVGSLQNVLYQLMVSYQIIFSSVIVLIIIGTSYFSGQVYIEEQRQSVALLSNDVEEYLDSASRILHALAGMSPKQNDLVAVQNAYTIFDLIYLIDQDGRMGAVSIPNTQIKVGMDMSAQPYYTLGRMQFSVSKPFISTRTGNPTIYLSMPIPGNQGLVVGELNLVGLQSFINQNNPTQDGIFFITDENGTLLAYPQYDLVRQQSNISNLGIESMAKGQNYLVYTSDGQPVEGLISLIPSTGWMAIVQVPLIVVYGRYLIPVIIGLLAASLLFFLALRHEKQAIALQVVTPLEELSVHAQQLADGDYTGGFRQSLTASGYIEVNSLADSFERMEKAIALRTETLRASEERFRLAMEASTDGLWDWDVSRDSDYLSPGYYNILGYQPDEYTSNSQVWEKFVHPDDRLRVVQLNKDLVENHIENYEAEFRQKAKNGEWKWVLARGRAVSRDANGRALRIIGTLVDLTDRKMMEAQIISSEKLAGLGTLAAGIAHELNTPLQIITGQSESLLRSAQKGPPDTERLQRKLEDINKNGWRCAGIVRSLLTYARPTNLVLQDENLNEMVSDTLLLIEHQLKSWSNITVITNLEPNLPSLMCDRNQISQLLINLINNSRDAMHNGGEITIRTAYNPGTRRLNLEMSDTGSGIPQAIREKIFDPFFTTKEVGEGTGLGLSIVASIVRSYHGKIAIGDGIPFGTVITISFPLEGADASNPLTEEGQHGRY